MSDESRCRIACVGDSFTQGDDWAGPHVRRSHPHYAWLNTKCRMSTTECRGNYPRVLQGLLGSSAVVRNYGVTGRSVADVVRASECYHSAKNVSFPLSAKESLRLARATTRTCTASVHATPLLQGIHAFAPHLAVLLIGTNDARHADWTATLTASKASGRSAAGPEASFVLALSGLLHALWESTPSVLLLEQARSALSLSSLLGLLSQTIPHPPLWCCWCFSSRPPLQLFPPFTFSSA